MLLFIIDYFWHSIDRAAVTSSGSTRAPADRTRQPDRPTRTANRTDPPAGPAVGQSEQPNTRRLVGKERRTPSIQACCSDFITDIVEASGGLTFVSVSINAVLENARNISNDLKSWPALEREVAWSYDSDVIGTWRLPTIGFRIFCMLQGILMNLVSVCNGVVDWLEPFFFLNNILGWHTA